MTENLQPSLLHAGEHISAAANAVRYAPRAAYASARKELHDGSHRRRTRGVKTKT